MMERWTGWKQNLGEGFIFRFIQSPLPRPSLWEFAFQLEQKKPGSENRVSTICDCRAAASDKVKNWEQAE
jgi:hypothetical protein